MRTRMLVALLLSLGIGSAQAADRYRFDTVHTQILFFVSHLGFSKSEGEFLDFDGSFTFDAANPADSTVEVIVQTASISMDDADWDAHMKNEDFFDVDKHPTMTFRSTHVETADGQTGKVHGELTLLGITRPLVLDVSFNRTGVHPFSKEFVAGFSGTAQLKRSDFGMRYGLPVLGDDVEIRLEIEGIRQ